jgi:nondiscriminating glutamyl-tRNA synthetase
MDMLALSAALPKPLRLAASDAFRYHSRMLGTPVKTRFAPSPTGLLHLGNARTALFNALFARHAGGVFLLRIEDTDAVRSRAEHVAGILEDLRWLGLEWQEGIDAGGAHGPYRQSERLEIYQRVFDSLERSRRVYPCFCSEQVLEQTRQTQLAAGLPPRYPGTCRALSPAEVERRLAEGARPAWRFRVPEGGAVEFEDLVHGAQRISTADLGDFVIRRADGTFAFLFTNAVDDALMEVTHVLRGEDHLSNTPRQILMLDALGLPPPRYGHLPLIVGADGAPLAKRHGSAAVNDLRRQGYLPGAVLNYLARLGHSFEDPGWMEMEDLAAAFSLERLGRAAARFDPDQLHSWQNQDVTRLGGEALWSWAGEEARGLVPEGSAQAFFDVVRENVVFPGDVAMWARVVFGDAVVADPQALEHVRTAGPRFFGAASSELQRVGTDLKALARGLGGATGVHGHSLFQPLRAALTGRVEGPELARLLPLMGKERALRRLDRAARDSQSQDAVSEFGRHGG